MTLTTSHTHVRHCEVAPRASVMQKMISVVEVAFLLL